MLNLRGHTLKFHIPQLGYAKAFDEDNEDNGCSDVDYQYALEVDELVNSIKEENKDVKFWHHFDTNDIVRSTAACENPQKISKYLAKI